MALPPPTALRTSTVGSHGLPGIRAFLPYLPPERLWLNPDCGLWETPRWVAKLKLAALVAGAARVRNELAV